MLIKLKVESKKLKVLSLVVISSFWLAHSSFALDAPRFSGDEVVVTASRLPQLISESPASITVVTKEEIRASGAANVADVLRSVAGVDIKSAGYPGGADTIRVRGSTADQVLLLVDGRRTNSPQGGWQKFDDIPLNNIERIEVVRGPASALYGADAVGGVINVITQKGNDGTEAQISLSTFNTQKYYLARSLGGKGWNGFFAAEAVRSDGQRPNSDYDGKDLKGKLSWQLAGKACLTLSAGYYQVAEGVPNTIVHPSLTDRQTDKKGYLDLSCDLGDLEVRAYRNQFDRLFSSSTVSQHKNWTDGLELNLNSPFLTSGLEWRGDRIDSTQNGGHAASNLALYLEKEVEVNKALKLVLGAREEKHSVFGEVLSPRLGLVYRLLPDTVLRSTWGESFRAPTFDDLYWPTSAWAEGNPDLKPERVQTVDVGIERHFGPAIMASLGLFTSSVKDMIGWAAGSDGIWRPSNVGRARLDGGEAEYKQEIAPCLSGFINYSYLRAIDAATDKELIYKPNHKANLGLRFAADGRSAYLTLKYVGQQFTDSGNTDTLPAHAVVDAGLGLAPLTFKVNNLFDLNYQESKNYPMPGRTFILEAAMKF